MNKQFILVALAVIVVIGGVYAFSMQSNHSEALTGTEMNEADEMMKKDTEVQDAMMDKTDETAEPMMEKDGDMMKEEGDMMKKEEEMIDAEVMMKKPGLYAPYSGDKLMMAETGKVVLFFKASWCPSCRALDSDIKKSLTDIPADVTILELDYDTETALKQKYGVTTQHTLVQVDAQGNLLKKWSGGTSLESVLGNLE